MEPLYIFLSLVTLHYVYFVGGIYFGLLNLEKAKKGADTQEKTASKFVSIIIPFRDEEEVLQKNLRSLEQLNYPKHSYEVIYVDDHSGDNSFMILDKNKQNKNIQVKKLPEGNSQTVNKKKALEYGVSLAQGEIIFASDADCTYNPDWINVMLKYFTDQIGFVAGPVDFEISDSNFSRLQQIEHASLILSGAGLIGINNPIICSGANNVFRKDAFEKVGGYSGYTDLASGDDSFLMTKIFYDSKYKVNFCYDNSAMVETRANKNVGEFVNQRKRWAGKAFFYKKKLILFQVVLLALFLIALPIELILGISINSIFLILFGIGFLLKIFVDFLAMNTGTKTLYNREIMKWFLPAELLHIPYTVVTVLLSLLGKFSWKGRSLKR